MLVFRSTRDESRRKEERELTTASAYLNGLRAFVILNELRMGLPMTVNAIAVIRKNTPPLARWVYTRDDNKEEHSWSIENTKVANLHKHGGGGVVMDTHTYNGDALAHIDAARLKSSHVKIPLVWPEAVAVQWVQNVNNRCAAIATVGCLLSMREIWDRESVSDKWEEIRKDETLKGGNAIDKAFYHLAHLDPTINGLGTNIHKMAIIRALMYGKCTEITDAFSGFMKEAQEATVGDGGCATIADTLDLVRGFGDELGNQDSQAERSPDCVNAVRNHIARLTTLVLLQETKETIPNEKDEVRSMCISLNELEVEGSFKLYTEGNDRAITEPEQSESDVEKGRKLTLTTEVIIPPPYIFVSSQPDLNSIAEGQPSARKDFDFPKAFSIRCPTLGTVANYEIHGIFTRSNGKIEHHVFYLATGTERVWTDTVTFFTQAEYNGRGRVSMDKIGMSADNSNRKDDRVKAIYRRASVRR